MLRYMFEGHVCTTRLALGVWEFGMNNEEVALCFIFLSVADESIEGFKIVGLCRNCLLQYMLDFI